MSATQYFPGGEHTFTDSIAQGAGLPYQSIQTGFPIIWRTSDQGNTWVAQQIPVYSRPNTRNTISTFTEYREYTATADISQCPFCTELPCGGYPVQTGIDAMYNWWRDKMGEGPGQGDCWTLKIRKADQENGGGATGYRKITAWNSNSTSLLQKVQDKINETPAGGIVKSINVLDRTMNTFSPTQMTQTTKVQANVSRQKVVTRSRRI